MRSYTLSRILLAFMLMIFSGQPSRVTYGRQSSVAATDDGPIHPQIYLTLIFSQDTTPVPIQPSWVGKLSTSANTSKIARIREVMAYSVQNASLLNDTFLADSPTHNESRIFSSADGLAGFF